MFFFRLKRTLKLGVKSLWMHRLRSTLTMLGIIFGVSSVVAMLAIGGRGQPGRSGKNIPVRQPQHYHQDGSAAGR